MDINIIAPGHASQEKMRAYYEEKLIQKFGKLGFLVSAEIRVVKDEYDDYEVSILLRPEKGADMFARDKHMREENALNGAIRKIKPQLDKYKGTHYRSERSS